MIAKTTRTSCFSDTDLMFDRMDQAGHMWRQRKQRSADLVWGDPPMRPSQC